MYPRDEGPARAVLKQVLAHGFGSVERHLRRCGTARGPGRSPPRGPPSGARRSEGKGNLPPRLRCTPATRGVPVPCSNRSSRTASDPLNSTSGAAELRAARAGPLLAAPPRALVPPGATPPLPFRSGNAERRMAQGQARAGARTDGQKKRRAPRGPRRSFETGERALGLLLVLARVLGGGVFLHHLAALLGLGRVVLAVTSVGGGRHREHPGHDQH